MAAQWRVVGGEDKGGILVREGQETASAMLPERLSTGAVVRQLQLVGDRMQYVLLSGAGPASGWVSMRIKGKELVVPHSGEGGAAADAPGPDKPWGEAEWIAFLQPPPARGKFVAQSTGRVRAGEVWTPKLQEVPKHLRAVTPFDERLKAKPAAEFDANMQALGNEGPIGHWYGIRFPYTLDMIRRYGKEWLTKALRAAGTMPADNSVTGLEAEQFVAGSMSQKCCLKVTYAKEDPDLHTELFVKYPFSAADAHERKSVYISRFLMNNDGPEMDFARILSAGAPMKCPKYYFGDICLNTGTAILITEKLPLPGPSDDFGPYELEAIPFKSVDYLLDKPFDYYDAMTRNIAKLAAWGKCGKMGRDIEQVFPAPAHPAAYFMSTKKRVDVFLEALYTYAHCLVPEEILGPKGEVRSDEWFVKTLRECLPEVEKAQGPILDYLFRNPDYGGFTHQNMNTDNAMFWRDEDGNVCSGFIDWGRFKRDNFARGLSNGYMCSDLCELVQQSDEQWIKNFIEVLGANGGPSLSFETFWEHYMLSWLLQGLPAVDLPRQLGLTGSPFMNPEGWKDIQDYKDPRIFRLPNYNNGMCAIIRNFAYYWKCKNLPEFWQAWKAKHLDASCRKLKDV